jgi:hypothetical protein
MPDPTSDPSPAAPADAPAASLGDPPANPPADAIADASAKSAGTFAADPSPDSNPSQPNPSKPSPSSDPERPSALALQATLVDFALAELVRQQRQSFQPLWSRESWAKLLIWLALNCGCGADPASLEAFAAAIGPSQTARMRRQFFERQLDDLNLLILADPADQQVLVMPLGPALDPGDPAADLAPEPVALALERVGLLDRVVADRGRWQSLEAVVAVPWSQPCT